MKRLGIAALSLSSCVWQGPADGGTERGWFEGSYGPALPACVASYDAQLPLDAALHFWRDVSPDLFDCDRARLTIDIAVEDTFPTERRADDAAIGYASYELGVYNQVVRCHVGMSPEWRAVWLTILEHELGHCFGLADDENTGYLMDGQLHGPSDLSPEDAERIRSL